ncbi:L-alanine-DL-glutamate epimerase-like enolase superfamily enzyme [Streptomonospora salina]|uniref:L-alanine-DL-glutamate epimerase-like enolase superfamily enzyme n=1 Tax=Streptomonospora salina TaxID=104205 RepID=A0A841EBN9_9ACTN|nr:enolase C-terminal domain-like protein [Streptomonospora salina]MBB5999844.1 L-alanine-DL-glutamate epimerase-like enolase superfamily enzyme [Streptomonospora salina]
MTIEGLALVEVREGVGPRDDAHFVTVRGAGEVGYYGPISERIGRYARDTLASVALGNDAADHRGLLIRLLAAIGTAPSETASWAVGAVDCAAWDLHGRVAAYPVADLLATGSPSPLVPAYASWLAHDLTACDDMETVRKVTADGWRFTKWGLRRGAEDCSDRAAARMTRAVERCSDAIGAPVAVDAVGTWTPPLATDFARSVDTVGLLWLEDPLPHHDLNAYALVTATRLPVAVGELTRCDEPPGPLIESVRPTALTLDVVGCGGLTRARQILELALSQNVPVYPHGRSIVPGLHLAAAFPEAAPAVEYRLQWEPWRQHLYEVPLQPEHGRIGLPSAPGLGTVPRSSTCPAPR